MNVNSNLLLAILLILFAIIFLKKTKETFDKDVNPLIVVMSCKKNSHLWNNILAKNKNNLIIFYSDPNLKSKFNYSNRILCLKCRDTYDGLPEKVLCMIRAILNIKEFNKYTHIFKVDDHDTKISETIYDELKYKLSNEINYGGQTVHNHRYKFYNNYEKDGTWHFDKCPKDSYWENKEYKGYYAPYTDGGCGYILSKLSMKLIDSSLSQNLDNIYHTHIYEDLMIGLTLYRNNINPMKLNKLIVGDKWVCNH